MCYLCRNERLYKVDDVDDGNVQNSTYSKTQNLGKMMDFKSYTGSGQIMSHHLQYSQAVLLHSVIPIYTFQ